MKQKIMSALKSPVFYSGFALGLAAGLSFGRFFGWAKKVTDKIPGSDAKTTA